MKTRILSFLAVSTAFSLISCEKPGNEQESKLHQLEKKAAEAEERQRQLETELAQQKLLNEMDAVERERTLIEQERLELEDQKTANKAAMEAELEKRKLELAEREGRMAETQGTLDKKERELTGLERKLSKNELDRAGREPLRALPITGRQYVSGPTGDFSNFYEPLGAYGSWFNTRDYGYVYQPTVVRDGSWRPYTRGRWAFTDHGWTWVSSEPFGWACYHYGRWALLRGVGWVWVPGSEWAPAWVTWRESPGHIGWAPLPPETLAWRGRSWDSSVEASFGIGQSWFSFVSYSHFGNNIQHHCLPTTQYTSFFRTTRNITHYQVTSGRIFCGGPVYRNVCDRIGRPFPIHRLSMDQSPDFGRGGRRLSSHFRGDELQVIAPRMDAGWNRALRPQHVNQDLGNVVVERTRELPKEIRQEFSDHRTEEVRQAKEIVSEAGGRESFERIRNQELTRSREEDENNLRNQVPNSEPSEPLVDTPPPQTPPAEITTIPDPEIQPAQPESPEQPVEPTAKPPAVIETEVPAKTPDEEPPSTPQHRERPSRPAIPERVEQKQPEPETEVQRELPQPELIEEARRNEAEAELEKERQMQAQREAEEKAANEIREQQEQQERARQQQEQQEQLERARQQQEQQERMREQQEQMRQQQEQQERMREQQEQMRQQQEEQMRQQQEQQERMREQQEQMRQQQEEQMRQQQEQQQQQLPE